MDEAGEYVLLPLQDGFDREGFVFLGWCANPDASGVYDGKDGKPSGRYPLYAAGDVFQLQEGTTTLYAAWAQEDGSVLGNIKAAIIHSDSVIPAEPGIFNSTNDFGWTFVFEERNVNLVDCFNPVVTTVGVDNVHAALTPAFMEELEQHVIASSVNYDPETQYIAWHVIKDQRDESPNFWHIDGTIQKKDTIKLDYDANGATTGAPPNGATVKKGTNVTVAGNVNNLAKPGYEFAGWNTQTDGNGTSYAPGAAITLNENTTLYAQWTLKDAVAIKYVATAGGSVSNSRDILNPDTGEAQGSTATAAIGYKFLGWFDANDAQVSTDLTFIPEKPDAGWAAATYTAKFEALPSTIVFVENGGSEVADMKGVTGQKIAGTSMPKTSLEGHIFGGWYVTPDFQGEAVAELPDTFPVNGIIYYAKWAKRADLAYTVNYYKDAVAEGNLLGTDEGTGTFEADIPWADGKYLPAGYVTPGRHPLGRRQVPARRLRDPRRHERPDHHHRRGRGQRAQRGVSA